MRQFPLNSATAGTYTNVNGSGAINTTSYAFNQPVLASTLPGGVGTNRSTLNETGVFGGIIQCCAANVHYAIVQANGIQTDPVSSQLTAIFVGFDPFTSSTSGLNSLTLQFGSLPGQGTGHARSTFVDNNIYAAADSAINPSIIQAKINGANQTIALPTYDSLGPNNGFVPSLAMATSAALGANYLAAGNFNNTYNFENSTDTVTINNFDGGHFSGTVVGSGNIYAGAISGGGGSNSAGSVAGQFYGPAAAETGGYFAVRATSGPSYIASGIFAGKR